MPEAEDYAKSVEDIVSADGNIGIKRVEQQMAGTSTVLASLKTAEATFVL